MSAAALRKRSEGVETEVTADDAEVATAEAYDVTSFFDLGQSDQLVAERPANEYDSAAPIDPAAIASDAANLVFSIVPWLLDAFWTRARRLPPVFGRW